MDNIVYSNGDPIPTDDPCEACRCRPPGFACVLKDCKIKPGCRAVRHAGQCCPEYICGKYNGSQTHSRFKFYQLSIYESIRENRELYGIGVDV